MNKHFRHILYLSIWSATIVVVWITVLVFTQQEQQALPEDTVQNSEPIEPVFKQDVFRMLQERSQVPAQLDESLFPSPTPTPTSTTESAQLENEIFDDL